MVAILEHGNLDNGTLFHYFFIWQTGFLNGICLPLLFSIDQDNEGREGCVCSCDRRENSHENWAGIL